MFSTGNRLKHLEDCCDESKKRIDMIVATKSELVTELQLVRREIVEHKNIFEHHDENEMEKYDAIKKSIGKLNDEIHKFNKVLWVTIGIVAVLNFLGITDSVKHIIRQGVSQNYKLGENR